MRSQRFSQAPLFKLGDAVTRVKIQEDVTMDSSRAVVAPDVPGAGYSGWGQEVVPAMFESLQLLPWVDIQAEDDEIEPNVLDWSKHVDNDTGESQS